MTDLLLALGASLVNVHLLTGTPGSCPLVGLSGRLAVATGLALASLFAVAVAGPTAFLLRIAVLEPLGITALTPLVLVLITAATTMALDACARARRGVLHGRLGRLLPTAAVNGALCGLSLLPLVTGHSPLESLAAAAPVLALFGLSPVCYAALHERMAAGDSPAALRGLPLAFITAGLALLALMGLGGVVAR